MESSNWNNVSSDYQKVFELGLSDYGKAFMQFVTQPEMLPHGGSVLDVGCGVGKYGTCFAGLGYSVALTDISENMIAFAERTWLNILHRGKPSAAILIRLPPTRRFSAGDLIW